VFDGVIVPALIAADEGVRIARPALQKLGPSVRETLRSPKTRVAVTLPLLALSLEVGPDSQQAQQRTERRSPARRISDWPYAAVIEQQADVYRLDPALVAAVIEQESHFDRQAYNPRSGARGLMQLTPPTAGALGVTDPTSPRQSISAGCRYLRQLLGRFHGNLRLALAAYNAGPTAVDAAKAVPAIPETRAYVPAVLHRYARFQRLAQRRPR
jgi:soluble lytic murein transglycosylase-like protein